MKRAIFTVVTPLIVLAILTVYSLQGTASRSASGAIQAPGPTGVDIPSPPSFVPFAADFVKANPGDDRKIVGRFFRDAFGSERRETRPEIQPNQKQVLEVIDIYNYQTKTFYMKNPDMGWISQPMMVDDVRQPRHYRTGPTVRLHTMKVLDFDVYEIVSASQGDFQLVAPDLNFYPLLKQSTNTGQRETVTSVTLGEQPVTLFEPPPGSEIHALQTPGGPLQVHDLEQARQLRNQQLEEISRLRQSLGLEYKLKPPKTTH